MPPGPSQPTPDPFSESDSFHLAVHELQRCWPVERWANFVSVVAVSGGADSVALLRAMHELAMRATGSTPRLIVAHFNHATRGAASDADHEFVSELTGSMGLECVTEQASKDCWNALGVGFEEQARQLRYDFLYRVASDYGARHLVTAHTADDVAETVLFRLARGTGLEGLSGIGKFRESTPGVTLVRPWVELRRVVLRDYLRRIDQPHREDESNQLLNCARNRIRHEVLPVLAEIVGHDPIDAIVRLSRMSADANQQLQRIADRRAAETLVGSEPNQLQLDRSHLNHGTADEVIRVFRSLWRQATWPERDMSAADWERLAAMASGNAKESHTFPGGVQGLAEGDRIWLRRG